MNIQTPLITVVLIGAGFVAGQLWSQLSVDNMEDRIRLDVAKIDFERCEGFVEGARGFHSRGVILPILNTEAGCITEVFSASSMGHGAYNQSECVVPNSVGVVYAQYPEKYVTGTADVSEMYDRISQYCKTITEKDFSPADSPKKESIEEIDSIGI